MRRAFLLLLLAAAPAFAESIFAIEQECSEKPAEWLYDKPQCAELELNLSLMAAAREGDASALELLEQRYWTTVGWQERHHLARFLLGRAPNDRALWDELFANAQLAVQFADVDRETFEQWCDEHGFYWLQHPPLLRDALSVVASDPRSRELLMEAVKVQNRDVAVTAIVGLTGQRHSAALPAVYEAMVRFPDDARFLARLLDNWEDEGPEEQ